MHFSRRSFAGFALALLAALPITNPASGQRNTGQVWATCYISIYDGGDTSGTATVYWSQWEPIGESGVWSSGSHSSQARINYEEGFLRFLAATYGVEPSRRKSNLGCISNNAVDNPQSLEEAIAFEQQRRVTGGSASGYSSDVRTRYRFDNLPAAPPRFSSGQPSSGGVNSGGASAGNAGNHSGTGDANTAGSTGSSIERQRQEQAERQRQQQEAIQESVQAIGSLIGQIAADRAEAREEREAELARCLHPSNVRRVLPAGGRAVSHSYSNRNDKAPECEGRQRYEQYWLVLDEPLSGQIVSSFGTTIFLYEADGVSLLKTSQEREDGQERLSYNLNRGRYLVRFRLNRGVWFDSGFHATHRTSKDRPWYSSLRRTPIVVGAEPISAQLRPHSNVHYFELVVTRPGRVDVDLSYQFPKEDKGEMILAVLDIDSDLVGMDIKKRRSSNRISKDLMPGTYIVKVEAISRGRNDFRLNSTSIVPYTLQVKYR